MELVEPSVQYKDSFIAAVKEYQTDTESASPNEKYRGLSATELEKDFESFAQSERSHSRGENLPDGFMPETTYWLIDGGEFIGRISIRHKLTERLLQVGGLIGYDIRPTQRKHGYGSRILALALPKVKELGLLRVLLTCDASNVASRKIIEKNGGVLENQVPNPETGEDKLRYWIDIH
mgnify:FL=1